MKKITPLKAIRMKCVDCSNSQLKEIRLCTVETCPLFHFRMGSKPKYDTYEEVV